MMQAYRYAGFLPPKGYMFTGVVPSMGSAGPKPLSLKEEPIAIAMGDDCKLRG